MSVKFDVADWRIELNWKEMVLTPAGKKKGKEKTGSYVSHKLQPAYVNGVNSRQRTNNSKRRVKAS